MATDEEILAGADPGSSRDGAAHRAGAARGATPRRSPTRSARAVPDLAQGALAHRPRRPVGVRQPHRPRGTARARRGERRHARPSRNAGPTPRARCCAADNARRRARCVWRDAAHRRSHARARRGSRERGITPRARSSNALSGGLGGVPASELRETDRRTPIAVRYAGSANEDLDAALATPVDGVPVGQLVTLPRDACAASKSCASASARSPWWKG